MNVSFKTTKLEKICNSEVKLKKEYGELSKTIMMRLQLFSSASNLEDIPHLPPTRRHKLSGNYKGMFGVDLKHPWRIVLRPDCEDYENVVNLKEITSIEIMEIIDYH